MFIANFVAFIERIVKMIQDLVAFIRKGNDEGWKKPEEDDVQPEA